ncbi:MAG: tRNA (uridine(34)/cytosine(34)/5-carboxymethylaminomethyluridine(34)-2'-O)-methyltransferase TrmL [Mycoplasmataceae bacterium]|jgi:tRNA (cytidine/uridine-2'-O-)-methyltransferase|nr:tRNA (uridine(34)/cytosine(34)/5-carboxymethylaminomethyluridine(34)-2'-O)-methyltransferase TrmL [Mycoplasmataceae bacterium]
MVHVVLLEPEIPENTGNIARSCIGMNAILHLIKPYGFFLTDKKLKRSGVDYWEKLKLIEHNSYEDFINTIKNKKHLIYFLTRYGKNKPNEISFKNKNDVYIVFGKESQGIPKNILKENEIKTIRIPASKNIRSFNLSNCVAILLYEYSKQNNYEGLEIFEPHKPLFVK